jgi:NADH:ubiquinone oxidoreductase subunit F (NADH-binding)
MSVVDAPPSHKRLLFGTSQTGTTPNLAAHNRRFGACQFPSHRHRHRWRERFEAELTASGLTGRGGAQFPVAAKLAAVRSHRGGHGVVVVNSMEGEPASWKDATLAHHAPHLVLDGAELMAAALGSTQISVCVARDRPTDVRAYESAVEERTRSAPTSVEITVCTPPAHYVAGEESALSQWLGGGSAVPTFRPDRPSLPEIRGRVALVDNAETLAHVALIARYGSDWFRSVGTVESPGTTLLTVSGAVPRHGVYEVALGTTVEAVLRYANAAPDDVGGVLLGGYGGTWLSLNDIATPLSYSELRHVGCNIGTGVVIPIHRQQCGLAETARIVSWMATQSAGQCGPCVFGLPAIADDMKVVATTKAPPSVFSRLRGRLQIVEGRGACRHPDGVIRLVRSAFRVFSADVDYHLANGPCLGASFPTQMSGIAEPRAVQWR